MKDNNFFTIKKLFYLCCIASIIISIWFKMAKAEEMDSDSISYINNSISNADNYNSVSTTLDFIYANYPYYIQFTDIYDYNLNNTDGTYFIFYLLDNIIPYIVNDTNTSLTDPLSSIGSAQAEYSNLYNGFARIRGYNPNIPSYNGTSNIWYGLYFNYNTNNITLFGISAARLGSTYYTINTYNLDDTLHNNISYIGYSSGPNTSFNFISNPDNVSAYYAIGRNSWVSFHEYYSNHNLYIASGVYNMDYASKVWYLPEKRNTSPIVNNTDGFKVFKTTRSGTDYIVFDALNAVPQNIKNGEWYLTDLQSTLSFDLISETSTNTFNYQFDIENASEVFPYNGELFKWKDSYGNLYFRWEIPFNELNLPDDSYGYINNVLMTLCNDVSMPNNVIVQYLGLYHYFTDVNLYGTQQENNLNEPDNSSVIVPNNPIENSYYV